MEEVLTEEFNQDLKDRILRIIKTSLKGSGGLTESDIVILFNWVRHQTDPAFSFVPIKYRTIKPERSKKKGRN